MNDEQKITTQGSEVLFCILLTINKYLKSEQSSAYVKGSGVCKEAVQLFKFFNKNNSFSDSEQKAFENAVRFATAVGIGKNENTTARGFRGRRYQRGRGRGSYQNKKDVFENTVDEAASHKP